MMATSRPGQQPCVGWVFAGGGARGAYEVGVCDYIFDRISRDLNQPLPLDVICGTSVGALHACALAAWADDPLAGVRLLAERWMKLRLDDVVRVDRRRTFDMVRALFGRPPRRPSPEAQRGGILDARPLEALLASSIDFRRIDGHLASGRLRAVSVTATHVGSGQTSVFYQRAAGGPDPWARGRTRVHPVTLTAAHALASAAIPLLFPAVRLDGALYCDGSLRQHVPLSPARHMGADALVVINPRAAADPANERVSVDHELAFPGPLFLLGKTLNALTLDRIDGDIEQLERVNSFLVAGQRRFGPSFVSDINATLAEQGGPPLRPIRLLQIRSSEDIGRLSAAFVTSKAFRGRRRGLLERAMSRLAEGEGKREADLLSYLLFDGAFARELIDLGRADARRQHAEILAFFQQGRSTAGRARAAVSKARG